MHKIILLLTFFISFAFTNSIEKDKFQILSNNLNSKDDIVIATGNVVAFSPSLIIFLHKKSSMTKKEEH